MSNPLLDVEIVATYPARSFDAIVIGAGVAGLTFALHLPSDRRVLLLTKGELGESNTRYAQGGISAAIGEGDSPRLHEVDTIAAGAGLCDPDAVRILVDGAPEAVDWLVEIGAEFDRDAGGSILLGREAAHSRRRVLHAGGDATGHEVERALVAEARRRNSIEVWEHASAIDLTESGGRIIGAVVEDGTGVRWNLSAPVTVIAAGGAGQLWSVTSNPIGATADGLAMAIRAGVTVADCEFVQFHPTVLALDGWEAFLVSEAVRGEGAYLRDDDGERFMVERHPLAELAPRDVVARGIHQQWVADQGAFLDVRHLDSKAIRARFPTIANELARRGLDLATDLVPVSPAAHYFMGGVAAGPDGRTSHPGLLALGEAACTGIHGANRLASNSLLEGLVFGRIAAERVAQELAGIVVNERPETGTPKPNAPADSKPERTAATRSRIKSIMSEHVGVDRTADGLRAAIVELASIAAEMTAFGDSLAEIAVRNMVESARAIAEAALHRVESRGSHFRSDRPATDPALDGRHSILRSPSISWAFGERGSVLPTDLDPSFLDAMQRFWDRSDYDKGIITNPFGFDEAAGERGLARTRGVVERLGNPLAALPVIHVAGSKGKGSTTTFLSSILSAAGYKAGRYTSPHLHSFRERIAVDNEPISQRDFAIAFDRALEAATELERDEPELGRVTAFELLTAASFDHFARSGCDIAVIETGLGGRWDASNIVDPLVSVITLIDLEHTEILGDTLAKIASEKAGIIKPGRPVLTLDQAAEALDVFRSTAERTNSPIAIEHVNWHANDDWQRATFSGDQGQIGPVRLGLRGAHQVRNAGLAVAALQAIPQLEISDEAFARGLESAWLPGRFEIVEGAPAIVVDGAHSPASAQALAETVTSSFPEIDRSRAAIIWGMLKGKKASEVLAPLHSVSDHVTVVPIDSPRSMAEDDLFAIADSAGWTATITSDVSAAIANAREGQFDLIVITGSLSLAAEARVALGLGEPERIPQALKSQ